MEEPAQNFQFQEQNPQQPPETRGSKRTILISLAAILVFGVLGYFVIQHLPGFLGTDAVQDKEREFNKEEAAGNPFDTNPFEEEATYENPFAEDEEEGGEYQNPFENLQ